MDPKPLIGILPDRLLYYLGETLGVHEDIRIPVVRTDDFHLRPDHQAVPPVMEPYDIAGEDGRLGVEGQKCKSGCRTGRPAEIIDKDPFVPGDILVDENAHDLISFEAPDHRSHRMFLGDEGIAGRRSDPEYDVFEQCAVECAVDRYSWFYQEGRRRRRQLPVAEMGREEENASSLLEGPRAMLDTFYIDKFPDILFRETGDVEEFCSYDSHVPVNAPDDPKDLVVGFFRESAPKVVGGYQPLPGDKEVEKPEKTDEQSPPQRYGDPLETGEQNIGETLNYHRLYLMVAQFSKNRERR
jgi:hypothetical protein